jgi:hypothetical protein
MVFLKGVAMLYDYRCEKCYHYDPFEGMVCGWPDVWFREGRKCIHYAPIMSGMKIKVIREKQDVSKYPAMECHG